MPVPVADAQAAKKKQDKNNDKDGKDEKASPSSFCRIGTNLLYDACTVANLYVEAGFARNFSFNLLATYSPWDISATHKFRTLLIQPEFRYYFKKNFNGHHIGVEGHVAWYNIALPNNHTRWQDRDGKTPLWGAGIEYGYVLPFGKHWGMDFEIAVGYARLDYDCFYNVKNGAKYTSQTKDYIGPTKVGVTVFYRF